MSSELPSTARERERERARVRRAKSRRPWLSWLARILAAAILFFAGLAIGRAIGSDSASGETNTSVRTLVPTTLAPQQTVTVTVSNP